MTIEEHLNAAIKHVEEVDRMIHDPKQSVTPELHLAMWYLLAATDSLQIQRSIDIQSKAGSLSGN